MSHATPAHGPTTDGCRYCWMCRHVCPTGFVTKRETHTPHGYALLVASTTRGVSAWDADTVQEVGDPVHAADRVVVKVAWHTVGRGPRTDMGGTVVYCVRNGKIREIEMFRDHQEALEAAGLTE